MDFNDNTLIRLVQSFFRGCLNFALNPDDVNRMDLKWQQMFLDATFYNELIKTYPQRSQFSKLFLKKLIGCLEPIQEVHDGLYTELCSVMKNDCSKDTFRYNHYVINNDINKIITIKETNNIVVNGTTGMRTWEAAFMLADWALCNKDIFANKNILELGSGVGFTGITIAKFCDTQSLMFSDCHNEVLKTIHDNIKINFPHMNQEETDCGTLFIDKKKSLGIMMLDWNDLKELPIHIVPDVVIGADIVYDLSILQALCNVIETLSQRNKKLEIYIASAIRNEETFSAFLEILDIQDFMYDKIEQTKCAFIEWNQDIKVCLLRIKNKQFQPLCIFQ